MGRMLGIDRAEVLSLRGEGLEIREIAERLGCSEHTVAYHLHPKTRETVYRSNDKIRKTDEYRKWHREYSKKCYRLDPEFRAKSLEYAKEYKRKRYWSDPEFRSKHVEYMRKYNQKRRMEQKKLEKP
jgi:AraC-like DNA-binding protein